MKTLVTIAAAAQILMLPFAGTGGAQPSNCQGEDLIDTIRSQEPESYQRILDHFATIENGSGIFWKVEKPGLPVSYLFGTAHVTDQRVLDWLPRIKPALENSRLVFVELAELNDDPTGQVEMVQKHAMLPEGETLDKLLTEDERKLLSETTALHGMPWFGARKMKPGFLAVMMAIPPCAKIPILHGEKVLDAQIIELAKSRNIAVAGLETAELQMSKINELDQQVMLAALVESARAGSKFVEDMMETTIRVYQSGRVAMTLSLMNELKDDFPANQKSMASFKSTLLDNRNIGMHENALPEMEKGGVFLAVGALHLPGRNGLVRLFQDSGFAVTPVE